MNYKKELRKNRKLFLESILEKNIGLSETEQKSVFRKTISIQNRTRGKLGELLGEVSLTAEKKVEQKDLKTDSAVFETPFGKRRVDIYWRAKKVAVETKMGYVYASKSIINQAKKDNFLLKNNSFNRVIWLLIKGGSKSLKSELKNRQIEIIEGWPVRAEKEKTNT